MLNLIKGCFELEHDEEIIEVTPIIKHDEQHYVIEFTNMCCASGFDKREVSISELLVALHTSTNLSLY